MTRRTVVVGSYMVRYPFGGMLSWALQYLLGLREANCDVYFVEKANYPNACFDPSLGTTSDDGFHGFEIVRGLLEQFGMLDRICFVDYYQTYHGLSKREIESVFRNADLFIDMGTHGAWLEEASRSGKTVLIDGEPGFTQMKFANRLAAGDVLPTYDAYFTNGLNVGVATSSVPTVGLSWRHVVNPVSTSHVLPVAPVNGPYTTVMNWQSHAEIKFEGRTFGQKDVEFSKFMRLPGIVNAPLEIAVAGKNVPSEQLLSENWRLRDAHEATATFDAYHRYIEYSRGELSVCKNVFVATNSGWTSDRSAAYLASGRPVIVQETGFSDHIPTGEGLFSFSTLDEAVAAIEAVESNYERHCKAAREIAEEYFDSRKVLTKLLDDVVS